MGLNVHPSTLFRLVIPLESVRGRQKQEEHCANNTGLEQSNYRFYSQNIYAQNFLFTEECPQPHKIKCILKSWHENRFKIHYLHQNLYLVRKNITLSAAPSSWPRAARQPVILTNRESPQVTWPDDRKGGKGALCRSVGKWLSQRLDVVNFPLASTFVGSGGHCYLNKFIIIRSLFNTVTKLLVVCNFKK